MTGVVRGLTTDDSGKARPADLGTGTPDVTKRLAGDGSWVSADPADDSITLAKLAPGVESAVQAVAGKADDTAVVKLTGAQTVAGAKNFSTRPKYNGTDLATTGDLAGVTVGPDSVDEPKLAPGVRTVLDRARDAALTVNGAIPDGDGDVHVDADVSLPAMIAAGAATVNMDAYDGSNGAIVITVGGKSVALIAANGAAGADGGTPPGQVAKPTATSSSTQTVTLGWAAPGVAGTNPISMYGGEFRVHGATSTTPLVFTGTSTGATLPDMPVASLEFHVRAGSVSGWGAWSAWSDPVDVQDAPAGSWDYNFVQMYADGDTTLPSRFTVENGQPFVITSTGLKCPTAGFNGNGILTTLATPGYGTLEVTYQNKAGLSLTMRRGPHSAPIQALTIDDTGWYEYIDALFPPDVTHSIGAGGPDSTFAIVSHPASDGAKAHDWCEFFKGGLKVGEYVGTTGEGYLDAAMGLQNPAGTVTRLKFTAA